MGEVGGAALPDSVAAPTPLDPEPFSLRLGTLLVAAGMALEDVLVIRHTLRPGGLTSLDPGTLVRYTREQVKGSKFPAEPPKWWVVLIGENGRRSRLHCLYENRGEVEAEETAVRRYYDLVRSPRLHTLEDRLVVQWSPDAVNWVKKGASAASFPVLELADREQVPFPGYANVLVHHGTLHAVVTETRYAAWQAALGAVQGIYLVADRGTGKLYVGKADGSERILGRWKAYAQDGHGGNIAMKQLVEQDPDAPSRYQFSLLRVFDPSAPASEVNAAESHFKKALLTQTFGLNKN